MDTSFGDIAGNYSSMSRERDCLRLNGNRCPKTIIWIDPFHPAELDERIEKLEAMAMQRFKVRRHTDRHM
jgi:hypothetical protein